ncbi:uncharacterized protein EMH_0020620 [Eimeria mitis]|uniref:Uncharacterized protein n=1 Tax=Eimeria mitis TaxID=44415 RepID=U6KM79_9EIME|nr:uncharacterized protein EMH_0020620 [Eimeria mitis]CDJ36563.1 hypothetical protein, conserved [Eimeria mitis]
MASLGASSAAGDTSSPSDSSEDPFDGLSSSSSNSSNSSSSSSSSSSSYNYFRGPQLEACASVGIASEPTECIRRSASEGAELASLDRSEGDNSCPEKQQQRPSTANAPGRLSLPSVVSISSFRLGPLGFRRAKSATADAPAMQEDTAAARAGASPSEALTKPAAAVVDAACSGSHADVEGHLPTVHPKKQLPLDAFSQSSPQAKGASVAVPTESRHVLQPLGPGFRSAAALELQVGEAEEAGASMQARARTSDVTSAPSGGSLLAGRSEQHIRLKDKHVSADSCRSPSKVLPAARSSGSGSISPYQNRRSNSEDVVSAYSPLRTGVGGATFFRVQTEGGGPYMQTVGAIHAGSSAFRRNRALTHFTSARFEAGPTPASAVAPPSSATRPWLARSTREMHVCSSTSAMLMALAQETPERVQSPESPKAGIPRSSFSAAFAAAGAAAKAGELAARAAAGIRAPTAGATDGFGSYSSFESTDPLTSRCDSFASAASRTRNDDEANVQCTRQHQNQKKEKGAMDEECQQVGDRTAGIFAAPRTEACDSPLPGSSKESDAASPPSSR